FIASATISTDRVYGTRTSQRRRLATVWIHASAGRRTLERFIAEFALVAEDVFITLVHELAEQVPLGKLYRMDGTDIPVNQQDGDAEWNYDHAEDDFYYGYGCYLVTSADNIPVAATFIPAKKVDQETAMRVTSDALAVKTPIWMLG